MNYQRIYDAIIDHAIAQRGYRIYLTRLKSCKEWSICMAFQSPAQNYTETRLNLGDLVHLSPYSTYLMRSDSNFPDAGIVKGSVLAIGE
jgi:hypothetical protein